MREHNNEGRRFHHPGGENGGHHGHGGGFAFHTMGHHHHDEDDSDFGGRHFRGGREFRGGRGGGPEGGPFGGPRGRARRGDARYVLLDALRDGPKHGYEIIKSLEERSGGLYAPSPGTVYPTMQYLEDLGHVRSDKDAERRVYELTDAGRAELDTRAEELNAFWARMSSHVADSANLPEVNFLREALGDLMRTAWSSLHGSGPAPDRETLRRIRQTIERCRGEIRDILAEGPSGESPRE